MYGFSFLFKPLREDWLFFNPENCREHPFFFMGGQGENLDFVLYEGMGKLPLWIKGSRVNLAPDSVFDMEDHLGMESSEFHRRTKDLEYREISEEEALRTFLERGLPVPKSLHRLALSFDVELRGLEQSAVGPWEGIGTHLGSKLFITEMGRYIIDQPQRGRERYHEVTYFGAASFLIANNHGLPSAFVATLDPDQEEEIRQESLDPEGKSDSLGCDPSDWLAGDIREERVSRLVAQLSSAQRDVIATLATKCNEQQILTAEKLEVLSKRGDVRGILRRVISQDQIWAELLIFPGKGGKGYALRNPGIFLDALSKTRDRPTTDRDSAHDQRSFNLQPSDAVTRPTLDPPRPAPQNPRPAMSRPTTDLSKPTNE